MSDKFGAKIYSLIEITNQLLLEYDVTSIEKNSDFEEGLLYNADHAEYKIEKPNSIGLRIVFTEQGVEVGVCEFSDFYDFAYSEITENPSLYYSTLRNLLFNWIVAKRCAFGFNFFYVQAADGQLSLIRKVYHGCAAVLLYPLSSIPINCRYVKYSPIYPKELENEQQMT